MKTACWAAQHINASPCGTCRPYGTFETHATCWTRDIWWPFKFAADFRSKYLGYCSYMYLYLDKLNFGCCYLKLFVELLFNFPSFLLIWSTLISLINVKSTLKDFEKFHPPQKENPPSTFIDFINIFHPPRLFQPPRLHYLVIITIFSPLFYSL